MIVEERMRTFINSLDPGEPAWLDEIRSSALQDNVPIIRMEMGSLLRFLLTLRRPSSILEVGTAVGYSALFMSEYMPENCHITTIEKYEKRIPIAKRTSKQPVGRTRSHCWRAMQQKFWQSCRSRLILFLWMRRKDSICTFCRDVLRLLAPGGLLVSDNVLQEGNIHQESQAMRCADAIGRFMRGCGNIYTP